MAITSAHPGPTYQGNPAHRRHPIRAVLLVLLALVLLIPTAAGVYLYNLGRIFDSETTTIENVFPAESTRPQPSVANGAAGGGGTAGGVPGAGPAPAGGTPSDTGRSLNILVMGSDSRGATTEEATSGAGSNQRADTLMRSTSPPTGARSTPSH